MLRKSFLGLGIASLLCSPVALADARVSVAHFAPFAEDVMDTSVSVVLNGGVALENVLFKQFTPYIDLPAGDYVVDIIPTGTDTVAITNTFMLEDGKDYTVYATGNGTLQDLALVALEDDNTAPAMGNVKVRVVHAAPFGPTAESTEVSIRTAGGDLVAGLQGVPYGGASGYLELPEGTYDLKVASNNGQVNYIDPLPVALASGTIVTLFAVGDIVTQDLSIIATPIAELPLRNAVNDSTNGAYTLAGMPGQGFWFTPIPAQNRVVGSWYTYNMDGSTTWFTFDSCSGLTETDCPTPGGFDGMMAMTTLYQSTGMTASGAMQMTKPIGTIDFNVIDCELIEATVTIGESVTSYDGIRLTPSASCPPAE
ncbi:MAG: DUF4397 domain-containing protein [Xanthomonadales bacterium]|nr:DUF4397 domain-containing protein [Xanthomonadales bacterium]